MSVKIISTIPSQTITMRELRRGQLAIVNDSKNSMYNGHVVLRTDTGVISLSNSGSWNDGCSLYVRPLPPGTVVELTSEV